MKALREAIEEIELFRVLSPEQRAGLAERLELAHFELGETVFHEGEVGDRLYLVHSGRIRFVKRKPEGTGELTLGLATAGGHFGEIALVEDVPRTATARVAAEATLLSLGRRDFEKVLDSSPELRELIARSTRDIGFRNFFRLCTTFGERLAPLQLAELIGDIEHRSLARGDALELDEARLLVVRSGELAAVHRDGLRVCRLLPGDTLGEDRLCGEPVELRYLAVEDCELDALAPAALEGLRRRVPPFDAFLTERNRRWQYLTLARALGAEEPEVGLQEEDALFVPRHAPHGGAACLEMVLRRLRRSGVARDAIRRHTAQRTDGRSLEPLADAAERLGLHARVVAADLDTLRRVEPPAILHWRDARYVVLERLDAQRAWIADPATEPRTISVDELEHDWTGEALLLEARPPLGRRGTSVWLGFLSVLAPWRGLWATVGLAALFAQLLALASPFFIQLLLDRVVVHAELDLLNVLVIGMLIVLVTETLLAGLQALALQNVQRQVGFSLLRSFYAHLLSLPLPFFQSRTSGDLLERFEDNRRIQDLLFGETLAVTIQFVLGGVYLGVMLLYSPKLTGVAVLLLLPTVLLMVGLVPVHKHLDRRAFDARAAESSAMIEAIHGIETVKALGMERLAFERWQDRYCKVLNVGWTSTKLRMGVTAVSELLRSGGAVLILYLGARETLAGRLSVGQLMAFTMLSSRLLEPFAQFVEAFADYQQAEVALERVTEVLDSEPEARPGQVELDAVEGTVEVEQLRFAYDDEPVLEDVSFVIGAGQTLALVGRSGSGKTTLAKLLLGQLHPDEGRIRLDGVELEHIHPSSLRRVFGSVAQAPYIFNTTIRENIRLGRRDDPQRIRRVAWLATADAFIDRMPLGYATRVGSHGTALSGGQRQRLSIARALYGEPRVLVFDEATSALDTQSERAIQRNLDTFLSDCTAVVIAHRLSTVRNADLILVLDAGRIVERGTHVELVAADGLYAHMVRQELGG